MTTVTDSTPAVAHFTHTPYQFDKFPDDIDTLSRYGDDTMGTSAVDVSTTDTGVRMTVRLLGSTMEVDVTPAAARALAAQLTAHASEASS